MDTHGCQFRRRGLLRCRAGQRVFGLFSDDDLSAVRSEEWHEADLAPFTAHGVPGYPNAVGRPQFGRAEVCGKLFFRKDVLPVGVVSVGFLQGVVKAVHDQLAFNRHRLVILIVKVDPTTESSRRGVSGLAVHGVRPEHRHFQGHAYLRIVGFQPGDGLLDVPSMATRGRGNYQRDYGSKCLLSGHLAVLIASKVP